MMIEKKTLGGSLVTLAVGAGIGLLNAANGSDVLGGLPPVVQFILLLLGPAALNLLTQYQIAHTPRSDPAAQKEAAKVNLQIVPLQKTLTGNTTSGTGVVTDFSSNVPESPTTQ